MAISNVKSSSAGRTGRFTGSSSSSRMNENSQSAKVDSQSNVLFVDELRNVEGNAIDGDWAIIDSDGKINEAKIPMLLDTIHQMGEKLLAKPGYDSVLEYKQAVQNLLKSVLPYIHEKEEKTYSRRMSNGDIGQGRYTIFNRINEKLENIVKIVINTQVNQIQLLQNLDEIKGLLINLLR